MTCCLFNVFFFCFWCVFVFFKRLEPNGYIHTCSPIYMRGPQNAANQKLLEKSGQLGVRGAEFARAGVTFFSLGCPRKAQNAKLSAFDGHAALDRRATQLAVSAVFSQRACMSTRGPLTASSARPRPVTTGRSTLQQDAA